MEARVIVHMHVQLRMRTIILIWQQAVCIFFFGVDQESVGSS